MVANLNATWQGRAMSEVGASARPQGVVGMVENQKAHAWYYERLLCAVSTYFSIWNCGLDVVSFDFLKGSQKLRCLGEKKVTHQLQKPIQNIL